MKVVILAGAGHSDIRRDLSEAEAEADDHSDSPDVTVLVNAISHLEHSKLRIS